MKLKARTNPTTQTKVMTSAIPQVFVSKDALAKMWTYIDECRDEIGWLGTAIRSDNHIMIQDVYLFTQEVHSTTTEITPEGLSDFAMELLEQPDGVEIWNNMRVWGHSHVHMGVTPSGQDDSQMRTFKEGGHPWFIRLIGNKKGEMKIDVYEYEKGLIHLDVPWEQLLTPEEETIQQQIYELELALESLSTGYSEQFVAPIKEEMKVKVTKKAYTPVTTYNRAGGSKGAQRTTSTTPTTTTNTKTTQASGGNVADTKKKESDASNANVGLGSAHVGRSLQIDHFKNDDEANEMFLWADWVRFAQCDDLNELEEELQEDGYFNFFTEADLERIYRVAFKKAGAYVGRHL